MRVVHKTHNDMSAISSADEVQCTAKIEGGAPTDVEDGCRRRIPVEGAFALTLHAMPVNV